jgi:hypothetical protein
MTVAPVAFDRRTSHLGVDPRPKTPSLVTAAVRRRFHHAPGAVRVQCGS